MKTTHIIVLLLALNTAAFAQNPTPKLQLAREVIAATQADKMFDGMALQIKQMASQMAPNSGLTPEQQQKNEALQAKITDLTMSFGKEILSKMDQIYADVYSEAELNAMKSFFTSPEGKSMTAKQPAVMAHIMPLVIEFQQSLEPKIKKIIEESAAAK